MINSLDVLKLAKQISRDSLSDALSHELLTHGNTLCGKHTDFPNYIERITPREKKSLGFWRNGEFEEVICLL